MPWVLLRRRDGGVPSVRIPLFPLRALSEQLWPLSTSSQVAVQTKTSDESTRQGARLSHYVLICIITSVVEEVPRPHGPMRPGASPTRHPIPPSHLELREFKTGGEPTFPTKSLVSRAAYSIVTIA